MTEQQKYDLIRDAILARQQVVAVYHGFKREMCPHAIGAKNGRKKVLFYQFGGQSSSGIGRPGDPKNWRCVFLEDLMDIETREGPWFTASNHSQKQTCIDFIDVEYWPNQ